MRGAKTMPTFIKQKLLALDIRTKEETVAKVVARFIAGDTRYSISRGPNRFEVGDHTIQRLYDLWQRGELVFVLADYEHSIQDVLNASDQESADFRETNSGRAQDIVESRYDPDREFRYSLVVDAEELCPPEYFTIKHLVGNCGMDNYDALELMLEYDNLYLHRTWAEIQTTEHGPDGRVREPVYTMAKFPSLNRYLFLLCLVWCMTKYPEFEFAKHKDKNDPERLKASYQKYLHHASSLMATGNETWDSHMVVAGEDLLRYEVWKSPENMSAYFQSLRRLKRREKAHEDFKVMLRNLFNKNVRSWRDQG